MCLEAKSRMFLIKFWETKLTQRKFLDVPSKQYTTRQLKCVCVWLCVCICVCVSIGKT